MKMLTRGTKGQIRFLLFVVLPWIGLWVWAQYKFKVSYCFYQPHRLVACIPSRLRWLNYNTVLRAIVDKIDKCLALVTDTWPCLIKHTLNKNKKITWKNCQDVILTWRVDTTASYAADIGFPGFKAAIAAFWASSIALYWASWVLVGSTMYVLEMLAQYILYLDPTDRRMTS